MSAVIQFGKSLLSEELRERVIMHPNMEEVANHVKPASILPAEAGRLVPMSIMIDQWKSVLEERREAILSLGHMEYQIENYLTNWLPWIIWMYYKIHLTKQVRVTYVICIDAAYVHIMQQCSIAACLLAP